MNLLLDTVALIWCLEDNPRLGEPARRAITDPANLVYVSAVSAWEIATKVARGRLGGPAGVATWLPRALDIHRFTGLPVTIAPAARVEYLPAHHRDPFDRLLIAQAISEELRIVTSDETFGRYGADLIRCG